MTRWFMMAGFLGATFVLPVDAFAQNAPDRKEQAIKGKKGKKGKGKKDKNDGMGPFKKKDYPTSERLRPLVLPDGMGEIGIDLPITYVDLAGTSGTSFGAGVAFAYGLGDKVELGLSPVFALQLSPDVLYTKQVGPRVAWLAYDSKEFDFAPAVTIPLTFETETAIGVNVNLFGRYVLSDGFFLFFGQGALPIGIAPDFTLALNVGGGLGWQANPKTALLFGTTPLFVNLVPDVAVNGIWNVVNANATLQYSPSREWDVGATLAPTYLVDFDSVAVVFDVYARFRF